MHAALPKQYLPIMGAPVLLHTLAVFEEIGSCVRIVIATDDRERTRGVIDLRGWTTPIDIVLGGERRQDSVEKAISAIDDDSCIVLVHDAARPCVLAEHVLAVVEAVAAFGAAVLAVPARDTLKRIGGGAVLETLGRSEIRQGQTPPGARAGLFRAAFSSAMRDGIDATDDVSLLERLGIPVHIVRGASTNLKITETSDLLLAEAILRARARGEAV